ncbi:MAG TPA: hypothetical protein VJM50_15100 [Pyrinomonadaceae bacterium]|nr:hypothetical protein [Pyrinomonadaceae bacterium]
MNLIRCSVVAMMGSLLLVSTAFAQNNPKGWRRFTSHTDKFDVSMPAAPTLKQESIQITGQPLLLSYYGAKRGQSDYAVLTLSGMNDGNWHFAHLLMLDLYCRNSSSFKATFQKDISLDGYVGRQFSLQSDERVGEWRIFEVDKRFFAIAGSSNSRYEQSLKHFFDSFSLSGKNATIPTATPVSEKRVLTATGRWLIILQTFSKHERARANEKMKLLRGQGHHAEVVNTDSYSNLKPGLLVLAMGPFSKRAAEQRLSGLRSIAPQSYIKAGW